MLKKNWKSKLIKESCMGRHFMRWYILSPNGNMYLAYRNCFGNSVFIKNDISDKGKSIQTESFQEAMKEIYKIEDSKKYPKALSDAVENSKEAKFLYAQKHQSIRMETY